MTDIDDKLSRLLYRMFCPESTELGEYHLGMLPAERAEVIRLHLADCPHCTRELEQLRLYLQDVEPDLETGLVEQIKIWIARLLPPGAESESAPAGAQPAYALRGDAGQVFIYKAGDAQLTIEIQEDPQQAGRKSLLGLVLDVDPTGLEAHLWQAGREVASAAVDELGNFILGDLETGRYELILTGPDIEIHVQELDVS